MSAATLDPRRRAFADALGRLLAERVWAEITGQATDVKEATPSPTEELGKRLVGTPTHSSDQSQ